MVDNSACANPIMSLSGRNWAVINIVKRVCGLTDEQTSWLRQAFDTTQQSWLSGAPLLPRQTYRSHSSCDPDGSGKWFDLKVLHNTRLPADIRQRLMQQLTALRRRRHTPATHRC